MKLTMTIDGINVDSRVIYDLSIKVGRDNIESQPDASVLNFTMLDYGPEEVGKIVVVSDDYGPVFTGALTDLKAEQDSEMKWTTQCVATGPLAILGHIDVGIDGWPEESDSQRIVRIIEEAGMLHSINPDVPGPALLEHPLGEVVNAADAARQAADDGMGVLWESPNDPQMRLQYLPSSQRTWAAYRYAWSELPQQPWNYYLGISWSDMNSDNITSIGSTYPGAFTLDPATAHAEITFEQSIGDWARTIVVGYGTEQGGGAGQERPVVTAGTKPPSEEYTTNLANVSDAVTFATTMLRRKQQPAWRLTSIVLYASLLSVPQWWELRRELVVGLRVTIPLPEGSPVGLQWQGYLEGWEHNATDEDHSIVLNVSDRQLTEPADTWSDITDTIRWSDIDPTLQWVYAVDLP